MCNSKPQGVKGFIMFKVVQSNRVGGSRNYGYVLLWASRETKPGYMLYQYMHWYRYKRDALEGAERINRALINEGLFLGDNHAKV